MVLSVKSASRQSNASSDLSQLMAGSASLSGGATNHLRQRKLQPLTHYKRNVARSPINQVYDEVEDSDYNQMVLPESITKSAKNNIFRLHCVISKVDYILIDDKNKPVELWAAS